MAIPIPMQELFTIQSILVKPITTVGLTLLLFGFYILLFGQSFYFLSTRRNTDNRKLHLAWITSLFFVATAAAFINAASDVWDSVVAFRTLQTQDIMPFVAYSQGNKDKTGIIAATYIGYVVTNCIADSVLLHRLYIIWSSSKLIVAFPVLASIVANAVGLATAIMKVIASRNTADPVLYALYKKGVKYQIGYYATNAAVNGMITLMIAGRIWWAARDTRRALSGRPGTNAIDPEYKTIIAMVLESGSVYPMFLIVHAALTANASSIGVPVNLTPAVILVAGIAPTTIILRSNLNRSAKTGQPKEKTSTMQFELSSMEMKTEMESPTSPISLPAYGSSHLGHSETYVGSNADIEAQKPHVM
ncbi:hypothetical protein Moror_10762 [Moniliophthora roreri MCA 2997]|uniref:Uncharacterized protein n=2 Tax=Moniliophthora roreri TaxID=221103 RepID=V2WMH8_MONRO|nr:hypothetical protein Moror_10762 [Moniliophthora roreri MCA 2997]